MRGGDPAHVDGYTLRIPLLIVLGHAHLNKDLRGEGPIHFVLC